MSDSDISEQSFAGDDTRDQVPMYEHKYVKEQLEKLQKKHDKCTSQTARVVELEDKVKALQTTVAEMTEINMKWQRKYWSGSSSSSSNRKSSKKSQEEPKNVILTKMSDSQILPQDVSKTP